MCTQFILCIIIIAIEMSRLSSLGAGVGRKAMAIDGQTADEHKLLLLNINGC